jgi:Ca2+-binding RTX toxin-like protein
MRASAPAASFSVVRGRSAGGLLIAVALAVGIAAQPTRASTVSGDYLAAPGEANHIVIDRQDSAGTFTYTDTGVSSIDNSPFSPCTVSGNQATCPRTNSSLLFEVFSGDMNDTISDPQPGYMFNMYAGSGNDEITATSSIDIADGGPGDDLLIGSSGSQALIGDGNRDDSGDYSSAPPAPPNNDRLIGKDGVDFLIAGPGADSLDGGDGVDELEGGDGNDTEIGGAGNDEIDFARTEGGGSDVLDGGEGDDIIVGSYDQGAPDAISCGPGMDRAQIGANDRIDSECERVEQLVSCPAEAGPCNFTVLVSVSESGMGAGASAARAHRGKRITLGVRNAHLQPGRQKSVEIWLNRGAVRAALRQHATARGLIDTKVRHRKRQKPKTMSRTRFGLAR